MRTELPADDAWALLRGRPRAVLGLAGAPGAGKSTLARALVAALRARHGDGAAAYVPLDGFHLANAQLDRLGLRDRKGSEPSFDAAGYAALLRRLTEEPDAEVYVPDFDRALDEPVAARHRVAPGTRLIVTEGNYLACDLPGWRTARELMAEVWYVDAPDAVRDARLMERHVGFGRTAAASRAWIDANDAPNAELVKASRGRCDRVVAGADPGAAAAARRPEAPAAGGPADVVVVSGPPGAGKTTVARLLAQDSDLGVHLHTDDFWGFITRGVIAPYLPAARRQNETVVAVAAGAAARYAAGGYRVVLDGVVGPWFLDAYRAAARAAGVPLHYVVLRPDERTTLARATARTGPGALTDPEPVRAMHREFADLGPYERHALDTGGQPPEATAAAVRDAVAAGAYRLG
ncbi:nucleoside/nucleotide kinase family protein [Streptomyces sp. WMMC500]|uniref:nucleoside/nucleotide kinase family protein n=1 Tax=Streptomyces sp. WMMC500 TaxID=3015154 RepID=UPI00248BD9A8|nr:nucleoside/nucleotide kinase family protein [Streptomyces sp. WMMC500]WBB59134.1 nucleoside/nucleotide kinase family protein [Streptomyces sp. WMMC500]